MTKTLYITANPNSKEVSYSMATGSAFIEKYAALNPDDQIVHIDLYKEYIPHIDSDVFSGWGKLNKGVSFEDLTADEQKKVGRLSALTEEFINADKYVFVTPFWNFSYPPVMKAYIDAVSVAGKSFKYTEDGTAVGLLVGKKAIHIQARGGFYEQGPLAELEMGNRHIQIIMNFFGITSSELVVVEGHNKEPKNAQKIKEDAIKRAVVAAEKF